MAEELVLDKPMWKMSSGNNKMKRDLRDSFMVVANTPPRVRNKELLKVKKVNVVSGKSLPKVRL